MKNKMITVKEKLVGKITKPKLGFNPDELVLTKKDVLQMLNSIEQRWQKNKKNNWKLILSITGMKAYISFSSEETIKAIWSEIVKGFNELLIENSLAIAKGDDESWAKTFEKIKKSKKESL